MTNQEIKEKLCSGELIKYGGRLYTNDELHQIKEAEKKEQDFDLLQLTKKIQL